MSGIILHDKGVNLDSQRFTDSNGFLTVKGNPITRIGVFKYRASELGDVASHLPPNQVVGLLRHPDEVFKKESVASFNNVLVTDDHPPEMVNPKNHSLYSKGFIQGDVRVEGDYLVGDLHILDEDLISKVYDGKSELSNGYYSEVVESTGTFMDESYDFIQTNIQGNHIAVVARGRAGSACRLNDEALEEESMSNPIYIKDGEEVEVDLTLIQDSPDVVEYVAYLNKEIAYLQGEKEKALETAKTEMEAIQLAHEEVKVALEVKDTELEGSQAELAKFASDLDIAKTEITVLKDAQVTPEQLDILVKSRIHLVDTAKELTPTLVVDGLSNEEIKRGIVATRVQTVDASKASVETLDAILSMLKSEDYKAPKSTTLRDNVLVAESVVKTPAVKRDLVEEARKAK